jgi:hypothetical protein
MKALQERAKAAQTHHDDSYYSYAEASDGGIVHFDG